MKKTNTKNSMNFKIIVSVLAVLVIIPACRSGDSSNEKQTLRIVYTDWSESVAITYLSSVLLEEQMEFNVILKLTDIESAYEEVANKNADIFLDAWLPKTHKRYYDKHAGELELIGITYPEARTGMVVPDYSRYKTIEDLKSYSNPVIGIEPGAGIMLQTHEAIEKYGLDIGLKNLSEQEMLENLTDSIKRRKEVIITGWEPHWIFARYNIRFLEDPKNIYGHQEKIHTIARKNLEQDFPQAVRFFERMQLTETQINQLINQVRLNEDPRVGVKESIDLNEYIVSLWVKNLKPKRKKIM